MRPRRTPPPVRGHLERPICNLAPAMGQGDVRRKKTMTLMRFDQFRELDRWTEQARASSRSTRIMPMEALRRGDRFLVALDLIPVSKDSKPRKIALSDRSAAATDAAEQ